jgi:hypothetical protein
MIPLPRVATDRVACTYRRRARVAVPPGASRRLVPLASAAVLATAAVAEEDHPYAS